MIDFFIPGSAFHPPPYGGSVRFVVMRMMAWPYQHLKVGAPPNFKSMLLKVGGFIGTT